MKNKDLEKILEDNNNLKSFMKTIKKNYLVVLFCF